MLGRPLQKSTAAKILADPGFDPVATSSVNGVSLLSGVDERDRDRAPRRCASSSPRSSRRSRRPRQDGRRRRARLHLPHPGRHRSPRAHALALVGARTARPWPRRASADRTRPRRGRDLHPGERSRPSTKPIPASRHAPHVARPVAEFAEVKFRTVSWLLASQNSGAFDPAHPGIETVTALVAIPKPALVTGTCPAARRAVHGCELRAARGVRARPRLGKAAVLPLAGALAARGFVVAAIDLPMHGERSYCSGSGANAQAAANDVLPCGLCRLAPVRSSRTSPRRWTWTRAGPSDRGLRDLPGRRGAYARLPNRLRGHQPERHAQPRLPLRGRRRKGFAFASANRLISLNFFRVRDALRQDVIDVSALVKALAPIGEVRRRVRDLPRGKPRASPSTTTRSTGSATPAASSRTPPSLAANPRISRAATTRAARRRSTSSRTPRRATTGTSSRCSAAPGSPRGRPTTSSSSRSGSGSSTRRSRPTSRGTSSGASGTPLPNPFAGAAARRRSGAPSPPARC